jgi:uncharacterized membrane protein YidH (DUF202 family)
MSMDIEILKKALARNRNINLGLGVGLVICGVLILLLYYYSNSNTERITAIVSISMTAIGVGLLGHGLLRYDITKNELIDVLKKNPQRIVWVYYLKVETMPYGIRVLDMTTLYFMCNDHEKLSLRTTEKQILEIMDKLQDRLPHATFGHNQEKEQLYRANPNLLRK